LKNLSGKLAEELVVCVLFGVRDDQFSHFW